MAFVYRSNTETSNTNPIPGPGHYKINEAKKMQAFSSAPFNQSSPRKLWKENLLPGPGAYAIQQQSKKCERILQNNGKIYNICQPINQTSIFKSSSKRFQNCSSNIPGPGQYNVNEQMRKKEKSIGHTNKLVQYLEKTKKQNKEQETLEQLFLGSQSFKPEGKDNLLKSKKQKKEVHFYSTVSRQVKTRPQTSTGPGSYELARVKSQKQASHERKHPCVSISKYKKQNHIPEGKVIVQMEIRSTKACDEKIQTDNLLRKTYNKNPQDFFGSKVSRFQSFQHKNTPGPGNYQLNLINNHQIYQKRPIKAVNAFGRSVEHNKPQNLVLQPFKSYFNISNQNKNSKKTIHQRKKKQLSFGSQQPRFKEHVKTQNSLNYQNHIFIGKVVDKQDMMSKVQSKKSLILTKSSKIISIKNQIDERPLCYGHEVNTIFAKNKYKLQLNAPFLSQAMRFIETDHQKPSIEDQLLTKNSNNEESGKNQGNCTIIKPKGLMQSNNPRFKQITNISRVSPCSYNAMKPVGKKEFNKLFL